MFLRGSISLVPRLMVYHAVACGARGKVTLKIIQNSVVHEGNTKQISTMTVTLYLTKLKRQKEF